MDYARIEDLLPVVKKELPKEKRLHKEIKKLAKQTNDRRKMYYDIRNHLSKHDVTYSDRKYMNEVLGVFTSVYREVEDIIDDLNDGYESDRTLTNAYDMLKEAEIYLADYFDWAAQRVKGEAKHLGIDVTKELKMITTKMHRDPVLGAELLVKLVDRLGLTESYRPRGRRLNEGRRRADISEAEYLDNLVRARR